NFRQWLIKQRKWIYDSYNYLEKDFTHLLKNDGVFHIKRKAIKHEMISFPNEEDESYFEIKAKADTELDKFIKDKFIFPSYMGIIKKATCTKTGSDYFTSDTSKYLDSDVAMAIEKIELAGFFWTDEDSIK
ncbi:MAG: hypothetical protein L6Q46_12960, partial [Flavobacterium sp.]|uniref:hypothetical protein n=1 Tax=Flavobacterium sp. TaxID=239 RepID=UPI0025C0A130